MKTNLVLGFGLVGLAALLITPALFVAAKLTYLVANTYDGAKSYAIANELYSSMKAWEGYEEGQVISHPYEYPYLECDDDGWYMDKAASQRDRDGWVPAQGHEILMRSFMSDQRRIEEGIYRRLLVANHSIPDMIGLTACIQATIAAPACVKAVKEATWSHDEEFEKGFSGMNGYKIRAATFCRASKALKP